MKATNIAWRNSLLCLQQPISIVSILILLLNDHVLKFLYPSWLTGKLSDFVGLFFFPFLLTAGLSIILGRRWGSTRRVGFIAFGIVAVWFTLLKTWPLANTLSGKAASVMLGSSIKFALDPTDLLGLLPLWPAWRLWETPKSIRPKRLAFVSMTIGVLASAATSPSEITIRSVTDLAYKDGIVYAADKTNYGPEWFPVAISKDGGSTWEKSVDDNDFRIIDEKTYPIEACRFPEYNGLTACYRVTATQVIQYGHKNPQDSKYKNWDSVFPKMGMIVKAFDLVIIPYEGKQVVLVAIGEAGILRKILPDGNWEIIKVLRAGGRD